MGIDLNGIARLVGAGNVGATGVNAPSATSAFVTTVKRTEEIGPFETVIRKAAEQAASSSAPSVATAPGAEEAKAKQALKARKAFETFALQTFIGSMMPKENNKMFGTGSAGKLWQSMMAEKLAEQIAASGRLKLMPDETKTAAAAPVHPAGGKAKPTEGAR